MKILVVHNFHRKGSASGDDQVFKNETELLEKHGNEVVRYTVRNDYFDEAGIVKKVFMTFGMLWSFKHYRELRKVIKKEKPDIVHIHTFFPLLSPSILYAAKREKCKVVATLHDTRFICPCATSLRKNELCNKCGDGHYFRMCKYNCFKQSKIKSFIVATIFLYHRKKKSFYQQIDKYICLNDNQIDLLKNIGFESEKIVKKYNFIYDVKVSDNIENTYDIPKRYAAFYGRIGEEKGIRVLEKIWNDIDDIPLVIMGAGPLKDEIKEWAASKKNVFYLGYVEHDLCLKIAAKSEFIIFPSIWYEGCSMVEVESEGLGKALVVTDLGFSKEAIIDGYNGIKVPLGNVKMFKEAIRKLWNDSELADKMGKNARYDYEQKYMAEDNYKQLYKIYSEL